MNLAPAAIPGLTVLISLAFGLQVFGQYQARRRNHQLAWSLALLFYAIAALPEVIGTLGGWTDLEYRVYYLFGAILLVPWLALGTAELLLRNRLALNAYRGFVAMVTLVGVVAFLSASLHGGYLGVHRPPDNCAMYCPHESGYLFSNVLAVIAAAVGNAVGTVILAVGAGWSAWRTYRSGLPRPLTYGNLMILGGALLVAAIASLTRIGLYDLFYAGQAAGVAVIFGGFLVIGSVVVPRSQPA